MIAIWLIILKYFGLCLAAGSSIWGTVNELAVKDPHGKRRLTRAGYLAIALTIVGLAISLISEDLRRRDAAAASQAQIVTETKKTNEIIIAGQPLVSLAIRWKFESRNGELSEEMSRGQTEIRKNAESSQGGVPLVPLDVTEYDWAVVPLLNYLASLGAKEKSASSGEGKPRKDQSDATIVAIMALDTYPNAVLAFGKIGPDAEWIDKKGDAKPAAGVIATEGRRGGNSIPYVRVELAPNISAKPSIYAVDWDLDAQTLANAVDRANSTIAPTGNIPRVLRIAVLHGGKTIPFRKNNFGSPLINIWGRSASDQKRVAINASRVSKMTLRLVINGLEEFQREYGLLRVYKVDLDVSDDFDIDMRCIVFEFARAH